MRCKGGHRVERSGNPVQNTFNAQQLGIALSKIWGAATFRMPEGKYLDSPRISTHAVVQIIMDAGKVNAANTGKPDGPSLCPE
jgi:hypothetical protein